MVGYTAEELRLIPAGGLTHPDDRDTILEATTELLAGNIPDFQMESRYLRKGGACIWARVRVSAVCGADGAPRFVLTISEDITERKRADEETRKLAALVENSTDFIGISSVEGEATFVNATGRRLVGLVADASIPAIPILRFIAEHDRGRFENEALPTVWRTGRWEGESIFRNFQNGESIPMWQHIFFITEEATGKRLAMATVSRDITERKRSEQNLQQAQAELAHIARVSTMGELAASIAHEVNQPLAAVVTNANASLRWLGAAEPNVDEARAAINRIVREGNRAADVIGRIRSLLKKAPPHVAAFDINELVNEVLMLTNHEIRRHGVSLRTELAPALPPVRGDSVQLRQVILNLVMNAIEATSAAPGGPRELTVLSQKQPPDAVAVAVRDSGVGIESANIDQIFKPFFTTKSSGMGMGLAIARTAIESHGGRLWATPNSGRGATFQFSVPATNAA
jgi:PAS domain S-box-containing protein